MRAKSVSTLALGLANACALFAGGCANDLKTTCGTGTELIAKVCVPIGSDAATVEPTSEDAGKSAVPTHDAGKTTTGGCGVDMALTEDGGCEGAAPVGSACTHGSECETGTCLPESDGLPGGYCSLPSCNERRLCPSGSHCYYSGKRDRTLCLAYCDSPDQCRDGYICQPIYGSGISVCSPKCDTAQACPDQTDCDSASGLCKLRECDPSANDPCDTANSNRICYPDTKGLTTAGGLCLSLCNPNDTSTCMMGDVCQPLVDDPANKGFCVPPVCTKDEECPLGSTCSNQVCQPPARCDDQGACADSNTACVGGAGGQCMPLCPSDGTSCSDMRAGLVCASGVAASPVCLPLGSFPGSACRSDKNSPCDSLTLAGGTKADMVCENNACLVECASGGASLCGSLGADLRCVSGIFASEVCLPDGTYPGGPCAGANHDQCSDADVSSGMSAKMTCQAQKCLFDCSAATVGSADATSYCVGIDPSLSCAMNVYPGSAVCLPEGSYPGGPCTHGACSAVNGVPMSCESNRCLITCTPDDPATANVDEDACPSFDASLVCAHGVYAEDVCLPIGSFPGGPCAGDNHDTCSPVAMNGGSAAMLCAGGKCLFDCGASAIGSVGAETYCDAIDASLTCASSVYPGVAVCLPEGSFPGGPCSHGNCASVGSIPMACENDVCLATCNPAADACPVIDASLVCAHGIYPQDVCLPKGSFPGGPCGASNACAQDLQGIADIDMQCVSGTCVVACPSGLSHLPETICQTVSAALTCAPGTNPLCVPACGSGGTCGTGFSCLDAGTIPAHINACLPNGTFLGAACASGDVCAGSPMLVCVQTGASTHACAAGCSITNPDQTAGDQYCTAVGSQLGTGFTTCATLSASLHICM